MTILRGDYVRPNNPSIASHAEQLQPLAKSYGYRIAKPSLLAQVVKR